MDDRLLAPCTADLLRGWTGPVLGYVHRGLPTPAVSIGLIDDQGRVAVWTETGDAWVRPEDLYLDLTLAECRDRVARALCPPDWPAHAWRHHRALGGWLLGVGTASTSELFVGSRTFSGETRVPALATLDPHDNTRLPDGSRLVDALALAAVWRDVSRG